MEEVDSIEALLRRVGETGGIGLIPTPGGFKVALALDRKNPHVIFDHINQLEISLTVAAAKNPAHLEYVETLIDQIRTAAVTQSKARGIDITVLQNVPEKYKH